MALDETGQPGNRGDNLTELTVSQLSAAIRNTVEDAFGLVRVRGEIGRVSRPGSGHIYLDLKDERAVLSGVVWRSTAARLKTLPEQGLEVVATGRITTFPGQSKYQIVIEALEPAGAGALMALLEARRRQFEAEGLFAEERKKPLPFMPRTIGVVTSPTGAVIRDVMHRISDRFPLRVLVWPVRVQGETCAAEVARAIDGFNAMATGGAPPRPDLIIVARGGGSLEDLWGFNDEAVVRAAARSAVPLISAIGHETDWSLLDLAADARAPTPTGAAEMAVPVKAELVARTATLASRLRGVVGRSLDRYRSELRAAVRGLGTPDEILSMPRQQLDMAASRLASGLVLAGQRKGADLRAVAARLGPGLLSRQIARQRERLASGVRRLSACFGTQTQRRRAQIDLLSAQLRPVRIARIVAASRQRLEQAWRLLESLSHERVLERGFALIRDAGGRPLGSAAEIAAGMRLDIQFHDGTAPAIAEGNRASGKGMRRAGGAKEGDQGRLF